jgi:hypothetical protein
MTGSDVSLALGEAHRAELRRRADRYRRARTSELRPAGLRHGGHSMGKRTVLELIRTLCRAKDAPVIPAGAPQPPPGERNVWIETADCAT